jgi:hypothetical protein
MAKMNWERYGRKIAYGKPKQIKGWPIVDKSTNVGIKLFQVMRARPLVWGYSRGKK